ncbi:MAG: hypothetical protein PWR27_1432 [Petroclostridium sp.]|jgi:hypothetical protein|uniref:hypothetical protein n=1 Tax=Petroclostridium xylanilyticum TaxID=1792311 RepID=UPI0012FFBAA2|nr:hypothetical protein [Petroclostridium xylanilyticum]MBZ4646474.1 hypothetical protein [Clostridia bacterium]MDK2810723.1 hypothetical protein [Petroclostridium sp.]
MKKSHIILLLVLIFAVIGFFVLQSCSFSLALVRAGLNIGDVEDIEHSYDSVMKEFKVIKTSSKKHEIVLALVTKDSMGFWEVKKTSEATSVRPNLVGIAWIRSAGAKRFTHTENAIFENEWHYVYYGTNAAKLIEFIPGQIPCNVTVNIRQAGQKFWIHLISFSEPDVISNINIEALLKENKCIPF